MWDGGGPLDPTLDSGIFLPLGHFPVSTAASWRNPTSFHNKIVARSPKWRLPQSPAVEDQPVILGSGSWLPYKKRERKAFWVYRGRSKTQ